MGKASKFTDEQKFEIALEMLGGKLSQAEICRKWGISSTYAYKLKDRAFETLRKGIGRPTGRPSGEVEQLRKRVTDLEQLAGDQALLIRHFKKKRDTKMIVTKTYSAGDLSVRRLAMAAQTPASTVGRWVGPERVRESVERKCPVSGDAALRSQVRELCDMPRHESYGYRRIWALLRRIGHLINKKTVWKMMHRMGLSRPKIWYKPKRPKRVEKMRPVKPNRGWQIDMTSFVLSDMTTLYLMLVIDCYSREIVGWTLDRRCRAGEWVSALRMSLESRGLTSKELCKGLVVRSDNGSQPCSKKFVEYLGKAGVRGQYTGYNAPDDNAYVERVIRTVKEEEVWPNLYDSLSEAAAAIEDYINHYNNKRIHSALDYLTPSEFAAAHNTLAAA